MVGDDDLVVGTDSKDLRCKNHCSVGCTFVSLKFSSNDLAWRSIFQSPKSCPPTKWRAEYRRGDAGSCGRKSKDPGNEVYE